MVARLSARLEVVSVAFADPFGPAFCRELFWAERRFAELGVRIVNHCDEAVVAANRRRYRPSIVVEALVIDEGDNFFTALEVTAHERQAQ